jgi:hypothetical protein
MYSIKKVTFDTVIDLESNVFNSTIIPSQLLQSQTFINGGGAVTVISQGTSVTINAATMLYLTNMADQTATYSNSTTVTVSAYAAINPVTNLPATKFEFNVYINGQYIDKVLYTWTPSDIISQTIVFNTAVLGYAIDATDVIVINGRWA